MCRVSIHTPRDFKEETCSIGKLSMKSSSESDKVLNFCLEPININSVLVAFKASLLGYLRKLVIFIVTLSILISLMCQIRLSQSKLALQKVFCY